MQSIENTALKESALWKNFIQTEQLTEQQAAQYERYISLLLEWNEKINLTRITDIASIIAYHFQDSLRITQYVPFDRITSVVDVGTGAGFPGIPLCIKFPHLHMTLLEVCLKKAEFLKLVIKELGLAHCSVNTLDWRTFLRQTDEPVDLVVSRAALQPEELVRMFKASSPYRHAQLVYWASNQWIANPQEKKFLTTMQEYTVGDQKRKYAFFKANG